MTVRITRRILRLGSRSLRLLLRRELHPRLVLSRGLCLRLRLSEGVLLLA